MNLGTGPRELKADTTIGVYQPIEEDQIEAAEVEAKSMLPGACQEHMTRCPSCPTVAEADITNMQNGRPVCQTGQPADRHQDEFS